MLTPAFDLTQNDKFLILQIKAPYTKVSETEIFFEGTEFKFYSKPYFLRLNFPGEVNENGSESVTYSADDGSYNIKMAKACPGEWFEGLDLQTKLLAPRGKVTAAPLVQVLEVQNENDEEELYDWEIFQNPYVEEEECSLLSTFKYGFASLKTDARLFARLQEEMPDLLDVRVAQHTSLRNETEAVHFCDQHYLADLYLVDIADEMKVILAFEPAWMQLENKLAQNPFLASEELIVFSEEEKAKMRQLPNKEYLLDHEMKQEVLLSLVDILFAYAYSIRTTQGEHNVESAWTICKLSATLSWLERFCSLERVVVSTIRRSLCYPLYRRWDLSAIVLSDTIRILALGPRYVLKCLLDMHSLFNESDPRYILNDLYIADYCVWIQTVGSKTLVNLSEALKKVPVSKEKVDLDLPTLEHSALLALEEEEGGGGEGLNQKFNVLRLESASSQSDSSSYTSAQESPSSDVSSESETDSSDEETSSSSDSDDDSSSSNCSREQFFTSEQAVIRCPKTLPT